MESWRKFVNEEASKKEIENAVVKTLKDEGGAAGLGPLKKAVADLDLPKGFDIKGFIDGLGSVGKHDNGDYILEDEDQIKVVKEDIIQGVQIYLEAQEEMIDEKKSSGKKDACYHKVKARYDVWPSAYASGALVKCRKVGAANWGNKSKKKNEIKDRDKETFNSKGYDKKTGAYGPRGSEEYSTASARDKKVKSQKESNEKKKSNLEERCQKGYKTHETRKTKKMFGRTYRNCVKAEEGNDPKKGTGKKPKGSGRRLYTDENPRDTVSVKFSTVEDIRDTFSKESFKSKSHKRQSQIINLVHQRVRAAYQNAKDPKVKSRLKKALDYAVKRKEASKRKTKRMNKND
jgi:hypothetical protein